jgi:hypothetical protein
MGSFGQPDGAGEHVGGAAGQRGERGVGAGEPVGRLVEGAVAAEHHDHVDAVGGAPWARRVAWPRRLVSARSTSWSADSAFWITTRLRAVTDEAEELTIRRTSHTPTGS